MGKGKGFGGGRGGGMPMRPNDMMRQAQKMQEELMKMQEELDQKEYVSTAGGGMVRAVVSGKKELVKLEIVPEAVDPEDVEMLQDLVVAAVNEALRIAETEAAAGMNKLTGGLNLGF